MPVKCAVCETDNSDDAFECLTCGKSLALDGDLVEDVPVIDGLEQTLHDPMEDIGPLEAVPGLERTLLARRELAIEVETVPGIERTPLEQDPSATQFWSAGIDLDTGREPDDGVRTPLPQDSGICPWCNAEAAGAVCDHCGRRRSRYTVGPSPRQTSATAESVLCPACFGRVPGGERCSECGLPFPLTEVV